MRRIKIIGSALLVALAIGVMSASSASARKTPELARHLKLGPDQPAPQPLVQTAPMTSGASALTYSYNWSGYAAGTGAEVFKSVSSTYVQPAVTCPVSGAFTVFWVGLDGLFDGTVEQDGTAAYCDGSTPEYFAWWEMYPTNAIQPTIPISAGDAIRASVKYQVASTRLPSRTPRPRGTAPRFKHALPDSRARGPRRSGSSSALATVGSILRRWPTSAPRRFPATRRRQLARPVRFHPSPTLRST